MAGAIEGESFIGNKAQDLRGILSLSYPMEHGIVNNWMDMEKIWQHVYTEELQLLSEEVCSSLISASSLVDGGTAQPQIASRTGLSDLL